MAYTTDYYHVLDLDAPSWISKSTVSSTEIRRAYKLALLAAHPDKKKSSEKQGTQRTRQVGSGAGYTIDQVKAAYDTLSNVKDKAEYDKWFLHHASSLLVEGEQEAAHQQKISADFILGLEVLDLEDFEAFEYPASTTNTHHHSTSSSSSSSSSSSPSRSTSMPDSSTSNISSDEQADRTEWTRACRCGMDKGFRIREDELVDAERRGDREVLVGCEGCSLWVRVGFEVEVEDE